MMVVFVASMGNFHAALYRFGKGLAAVAGEHDQRPVVAAHRGHDPFGFVFAQLTHALGRDWQHELVPEARAGTEQRAGIDAERRERGPRTMQGLRVAAARRRYGRRRRAGGGISCHR
jgi:hypothetical protein